ncbi:MAG: putative MPP superfamily phosphohydrolase [Urechidicola sp.]
MSEEPHVSAGKQFRRPTGPVVTGFLLATLALHVPLFFYPILRLCAWLELPWWQTLLIFIPLASSQVVSRLFLRHNASPAVRQLRRATDLWLGLSPVVLCTLLAAEVLVLLGLVMPYAAAVGVIGTSSLIGVLGVAAAMTPRVKTIAFASAKLQQPVRFVQITDVHIGSRSKGFLDRVIGQVNDLAPEFLCITGDFIDAPGISEETLGALKRVSVPIYYCTGNHEKYEDFDAILTRLNNLGVKILRDDTLHHRHDLQVIGIDDMEDASQVKRQLAHLDIDLQAFVLLLYHRPKGLEAAADAGVDLMISGHTHNGQIMPFNLLVRRVFDRIAGMYEFGQTRLYVSQGTGTWGPVMRVGTSSEITLFELDVAQSR